MNFRDKSIGRLYALALAAVFALTLAGCGGGGGRARLQPLACPLGQIGTPPNCTVPAASAAGLSDRASRDASELHRTAASAAATAYAGMHPASRRDLFVYR